MVEVSSGGSHTFSIKGAVTRVRGLQAGAGGEPPDISPSLQLPLAGCTPCSGSEPFSGFPDQREKQCLGAERRTALTPTLRRQEGVLPPLLLLQSKLGQGRVKTRRLGLDLANMAPGKLVLHPNEGQHDS